MLLSILALAVVIGLIIFGLQLSVRLVTRLMVGELAERLRAGECIVNDQSVPESWLAQPRKRIAALRSAGKSDDEIERAGQAAKAACLRKLDDLIGYFGRTNVTDSPDTKATLLRALSAQRARWAAAPWHAFFDMHTPLPSDNHHD
jgi:hypothetical protein